jgi:hypothetical protein
VTTIFGIETSDVVFEEQPNGGLAFSPDVTLLLIAESEEVISSPCGEEMRIGRIDSLL